MVYVYEVFPDDSVNLVASYECMSDFFDSEFYGRENVVYEVKEVC